MGYKIAWVTEGGWNGKVPRNHPNMRNDMAWMHTLDVIHNPIVHLPSMKDDEYDEMITDCTQCEGSGLGSSAEGNENCTNCNGTGQIEE